MYKYCTIGLGENDIENFEDTLYYIILYHIYLTRALGICTRNGEASPSSNAIRRIPNTSNNIVSDLKRGLKIYDM